MAGVKSSKKTTRYPMVKMGFGTSFTEKLSLRSLFKPWFWYHLRDELRWAGQRALRGYDEYAVWDMTSYIPRFLIRGLSELADNHQGVPQFGEWADKPIDEQSKLWAARLLEIADHLYNSGAWGAEDENEKPPEYWQEQVTLGMEKLAKVLGYLWD